MEDTNHPKGQILAYLRVSSADQNLDRQRDVAQGADRVFEEKQSGKNATGRPVLQELIAYARQGDQVRVHSIDRLSRSLIDLHNLVEQFQAKGVAIHFAKEGLTFDPTKTADPMSVLLFQILGSFAEFERALIRARQAEGIAKAKERGTYKRGTAVTVEQVERAKELVALGLTKAEVARRMGWHRSHLYVVLDPAFVPSDGGGSK